MAVNKVEYGGNTLIDLTEDSVTPQTLILGATAHNRAGEKIDGEFDPSIFQLKEDDGLDTDDQTVVGAINGLNADFINLNLDVSTLMVWYNKEHYVNLAFKEKDENGNTIPSPTYTSTTLEMRPSTRAYSVTFSWQFNKTPTTLTVGGTSMSTSTTSYTQSFYSTTETSKTFSVVGKYNGDYEEEEARRDWTFYFRNKVYWGVKAESTINDAFILGLSRSAYATTYNNTGFNLGDSSADNYIWYCFPKRFETTKTPSFTIGNVPGGFLKVEEYEFTNSSGFKEWYSIYRSTNKGVGKATVTVS